MKRKLLAIQCAEEKCGSGMGVICSARVYRAVGCAADRKHLDSVHQVAVQLVGAQKYGQSDRRTTLITVIAQ